MSNRKTSFAASLFGCVALWVSVASQAAVIGLSNASFESPAPGVGWTSSGDASNGYWNYAVQDWVVGGTGGTWRPGTGMFASIPDGLQVAWLAGGATLTQQTAAVLQTGYTYTLSALVGTRDNSAPGYDSTYAGGRIELLAGNTVIAAATAGAPAQGGWVQTALAFTYNSVGADPLLGQSLSVRLVALGGGQTNFDSVSLTAVPLPAAAWLFGTALIGLGAARRMQRRSDEGGALVVA